MTVKEFAMCVEYNIQHGIKHAILGLGAPGVGKSQLIHQIGKKYGYKVIDVRLAQMSEVEIGGLIYPNESRTKTVWLAPDILPDEERDGPKTILLLDEITSCTKRVQVAAYQLILDRKIGQYTLPEGTFVIALGNREDDDGVYIQLAAPLADRFEIHYMEPSFDDWKNDFAIPRGVHPLVVNYLTFKPAALHTQAAEGDNMRFATPRSWVRVSDILKVDSNIENPVIRHKIIGNVGEVEGQQFVEYARTHKDTVTADEFLAGKNVSPQQHAEISFLIAALSAKASFVKNVPDTASLTPKQRDELEKIILAMHRLPGAEFTLIGMKNLLDLQRPVVKEIYLAMDHKSIHQFINANKDALQIVPAKEKNQNKKRNWLAMWEKE